MRHKENADRRVEITRLPIAVRVYPDPLKVNRQRASRKRWRIPDAVLVFDTETRTDASQKLIFGSYQFFVRGKLAEEGIFYAPELPKEELKVLRDYVAKNTEKPGPRLLTLNEFLKRFYAAAYKGRCLVIGFNLPFDFSRLAHDATYARGAFEGGFSLGLWSYTDKRGKRQRNQFRPRIGVKQIDSKRALKGFTARHQPDDEDLIPEDPEQGESGGKIFRGHFVDLRTLAFALTDQSYTLEAACQAFGVEHGKKRAKQHGKVTPEYIDYNRNDVSATAELADKLLAEYAKHPIPLQVTKAYSPASIGKSYLRAMGIPPILERQPDFPAQYLGYAQTAFYGGRTSAHIRRTLVPVVSVDFLSMYPTVNNLMGLWRFVTCEKIEIEKHCATWVRKFLKRLTAKELFKPETWRTLTGFVKIIPTGDILPTRGKYASATNDWQVAVNYVTGDSHDSHQALWFSLPDVAASVLLTGRIPKIVDAFRLDPRGLLKSLQPTKLRGSIEVDPRSEDFFKAVIEQRQSLSTRKDLSEDEKQVLDRALKVLANATSYGIYAEMIRQENNHKIRVTCHGIDPGRYECCVNHPEVPGEYCFSPLASLITGAARLMLALLEHCLAEAQGTYAMEDTDAMAIVATKHRGLIPCPGGQYRTSKDEQAVRALSWNDVRRIAQRFGSLNPYSRELVQSILKIEKVNFHETRKKPRQLYCLAISAKRYALFTLDKHGNPKIVKHSEHGLGHLLNPTDLDSPDRDWIEQVWLNMIRKSMNLPRTKLGFEGLPAVGRVTVSSPAIMRPLASFNSGKQYARQLKPFNFLLTCHVRAFGHPTNVDPKRFHLLAPYATEPQMWLRSRWFDQYSGKSFRITTNGDYGSPDCTRVKTYGEFIAEYEYHAESKCADAGGNPSTKQTIGLLQRRYIQPSGVRYIGKESNCLEAVTSGTIHSDEGVYTEYPDPRRDPWITETVPALKKIPLSVLVSQTGMSRSELKELRAGRSRPHKRNREKLFSTIAEMS